MNKSDKKLQLANKINSKLDEYYFDIDFMSSTKIPLNESQFIALISKCAVAAATAWWSALELKDYLKTRKLQSTIEDSIHDLLS